ncbi:MAG: glyoxalase [Rhodomicrobium sp.]|nr:MAG: glyoxalase [Rhodomicrobium sp.]
MTFKPAQPIFRSFDEAKASEFYIDYLGFQVDWEHRFEEDAPLYMQVSLGEVVLHLSEHHGDATPGSAIRIECADIEEYHAKLMGKGYRFANPGLLDQSWGCRELILTDPFGNRIVFFVDLPNE